MPSNFSTVTLRMHGTIRLGGKWAPFQATETLRTDGSMTWNATVTQGLMRIVGSDSLAGGEGAMKWKLFGLIPVMSGSGPDITRSAIGRVAAESIWLPAMLAGPNVEWVTLDDTHERARLTLYGETVDLEFAYGEGRRLESVKLERWGDPDNAGFRMLPFGALCSDERKFGSVKIPTTVRVGWYFGTERFERDGEFFRATVDHAHYQ